MLTADPKAALVVYPPETFDEVPVRCADNIAATNATSGVAGPAICDVTVRSTGSIGVSIELYCGLASNSGPGTPGRSGVDRWAPHGNLGRPRGAPWAKERWMAMAGRRVVLFGGSGFVGRHL